MFNWKLPYDEWPREQLREFASEVGDAWYWPDWEGRRVQWRYEPHYPLKGLRKLYDEPVKRWLKREAESRPDYFIQFEEAFRTGRLGDPIVFGENMFGQPVWIGDGWHRTAYGLITGRKTIPAIVARKRHV